MCYIRRNQNVERQAVTSLGTLEERHVPTSTAYTTSADFCKIFADEMSSLYMLGFLLTADQAKAEQCFVAGIGDCVEGNSVFKEWARSWARRTIVQHAIQRMAPAEGRRRVASAAAPSVGGVLTAESVNRTPLDAILKLDTLERFVFVMSVLEGYSYQDCSILLGCPRQAVVDARARALESLTRASEVSIMRDEELHAAPTLHTN
jgi:DNA-directed RNA polymerase specialized sigma24 family protein